MTTYTVEKIEPRLTDDGETIPGGFAIIKNHEIVRDENNNPEVYQIKNVAKRQANWYNKYFKAKA